MVTITGASIKKPEDVWDIILDILNIPSETSRTNVFGGDLGVGGEVAGQLGLPFLGKAETHTKADMSVNASTEGNKTHRRRGMNQVVEEIAGTEFVVLIDDFHYMEPGVQEEVAEQIKEVVRQGVKIITASVPHRSDDVVRANPELRGRVMSIDIGFWNRRDLISIADLGYDVLNTELAPGTYEIFAGEAAGSPQLMQSICLSTCFEMEIRSKSNEYRTVAISEDDLRRIFERTASTTNFRSLVNVMDEGPKTRGTDRKTFYFRDGTKGDVYRCVLKAISADPLNPSFSYNDIISRIDRICLDEKPSGSSITESCYQMWKLISDRFPNEERAIDWDRQNSVLNIPNPHLLFYLRWSGRLLENRTL